jgi:hypothetical protein
LQRCPSMSSLRRVAERATSRYKSGGCDAWRKV